MILEGMNYLVSKDITQLSISCETIYINIQGEIKLGEIVFESKMKRLNRSIKKIKSEAELESVNTTQICDFSNLIINFGKTVLNMLFSNVNTYKLVVKLIHPLKWDFLLKNILQEELRNFLKKIFTEANTCTIADLLQHKFLKQRKNYNDEKLKIGIELSDFIELNKRNKAPAEINNSIIPYSIVEEDSMWNLQFY